MLLGFLEKSSSAFSVITTQSSSGRAVSGVLGESVRIAGEDGRVFLHQTELGFSFSRTCPAPADREGVLLHDLGS